MCAPDSRIQAKLSEIEDMLFYDGEFQTLHSLGWGFEMGFNNPKRSSETAFRIERKDVELDRETMGYNKVSTPSLFWPTGHFKDLDKAWSCVELNYQNLDMSFSVNLYLDSRKPRKCQVGQGSSSEPRQALSVAITSCPLTGSPPKD